MEIYFGVAFYEHCLKQKAFAEVISRAVKAGIITVSGAEYLRRLS